MLPSEVVVIFGIGWVFAAILGGCFMHVATVRGQMLFANTLLAQQEQQAAQQRKGMEDATAILSRSVAVMEQTVSLVKNQSTLDIRAMIVNYVEEAIDARNGEGGKSRESRTGVLRTTPESSKGGGSRRKKD